MTHAAIIAKAKLAADKVSFDRCDLPVSLGECMRIGLENSQEVSGSFNVSAHLEPIRKF